MDQVIELVTSKTENEFIDNELRKNISSVKPNAKSTVVDVSPVALKH